MCCFTGSEISTGLISSLPHRHSSRNRVAVAALHVPFAPAGNNSRIRIYTLLRLVKYAAISALRSALSR